LNVVQTLVTIAIAIASLIKRTDWMAPFRTN
jgi:hypothetical protein